jgi:hypothetical protein
MKCSSACRLLLVVCCLAISMSAQSQLSGMVYTTMPDGSIVDTYSSLADVYFDGGPPPTAPCTSGGLPDSWYYFQ